MNNLNNISNNQPQVQTVDQPDRLVTNCADMFM